MHSETQVFSAIVNRTNFGFYYVFGVLESLKKIIYYFAIDFQQGWCEVKEPFMDTFSSYAVKTGGWCFWRRR